MTVAIPAPGSSKCGSLVSVTDNYENYKEIVTTEDKDCQRQELGTFETLAKAEAYIAKTYGLTHYWRTDTGTHTYYTRRRHSR